MCQIRQWAIRRERPQRESWSIFGRGIFAVNARVALAEQDL